MTSLQYCAPCLFGLEGLVADELRKLDAVNVRAENGRVLFEGDALNILSAEASEIISSIVKL
jgi:putative N6-adenine-specific DNA methylase